MSLFATAIVGSYDYRLVTLSVFIATLASYAALDLSGRVTSAHGRTRLIWLAGGAVAMGCGIWSMHYIGMLAFRLPVPVQYDWPTVLLSLLAAVFAAAVALFVVSRRKMGLFRADRRTTVQALELESSEQRYCQIVDAVLDSYVGADSNGIITDWNAQAETTFGWPRSEAIGQSVYQTIVPNRHRHEHQHIVDELLASPEASVMRKRVETTRLHRDGHEFPVELSISVIRAGNTHRFGAFIRDITERKRSERELTAAKESAEAGSRAKSEFLANMNHEIRTPLNGVVGMTDLALGTDLTSEQREYLETVKLSADSLLTVINDILDFSKVEAGKMDLELDDFNLRDCLEATLKTLALRADEKGLELLCEIAPSVPDVVRGDSKRLRQVLLNLVGNAIKFTGKGEVALNVHVEAEDGDDRTLHFTVSDSGIGIPPEKRKLIFQPFAQADNSTTRKYGGTGLGLTISKRLVGLMDGKMWVESQVGRGTQFHFTARLKTSGKPIEVGAIVSLEMLRGVRVLIVDDNRTNRRILEGMLKRWQMRATSVEDGEDALAQLCSAKGLGDSYGLVLTDTYMPKMDGFDLIEQIRQRPELSAVTIMMLTSAGHRGDAERCRELGVAAYLSKPIRQSELREAIARVLGAQKQTGLVPPVTSNSLHDPRDPETVLHVLVAEDNAVNQRLAVRMLEKRGHRVVVANNGREALDALAKDLFDLVFMDVQMPEIDGLQATTEIREMEKGTARHQIVIAMTTHATRADHERCLAAGMDGYLAKPIRPQELDDVLQKYVAPRIESEARATS